MCQRSAGNSTASPASAKAGVDQRTAVTVVPTPSATLPRRQAARRPRIPPIANPSTVAVPDEREGEGQRMRQDAADSRHAEAEVAGRDFANEVCVAAPERTARRRRRQPAARGEAGQGVGDGDRNPERHGVDRPATKQMTSDVRRRLERRTQRGQRRSKLDLREPRQASCGTRTPSRRVRRPRRSRGSAISSIPYMVRTRPAARVRSASAGKPNAHHDPVSSASCVCASASTEPQVAPFVSPSAKRPRDSEARKSRVASATIAWMATKKAPAATRLAMLGTNSKNRIRIRLSPTAVADATKSVLRSVERLRPQDAGLRRPAPEADHQHGREGGVLLLRHDAGDDDREWEQGNREAHACDPAHEGVDASAEGAGRDSERDGDQKGDGGRAGDELERQRSRVQHQREHVEPLDRRTERMRPRGRRVARAQHRHDRPVARRDERSDDRGGEHDREQRDAQTRGAVGDERCQESNPPARPGAERGRELDLGGGDGHRLDPMSLARASRRCGDRPAFAPRAGRRRTPPGIPRPSATAPRSRVRAAARRG